MKFIVIVPCHFFLLPKLQKSFYLVVVTSPLLSHQSVPQNSTKISAAIGLDIIRFRPFTIIKMLLNYIHISFHEIISWNNELLFFFTLIHVYYRLLFIFFLKIVKWLCAVLKLQYKTSFIFLFTPLNRYRDSTESNKWENAAREILRNLRRLSQYGPRCYHIKRNNQCS